MDNRNFSYSVYYICFFYVDIGLYYIAENKIILLKKQIGVKLLNPGIMFKAV